MVTKKTFIVLDINDFRFDILDNQGCAIWFYNEFVHFAKIGAIFAMLRQDKNLGDTTILLKMEWQFSAKTSKYL